MLPFVFFKCICKSKSIFSKKLEKNYELPRKTCDFAQSVLYFLIINRYNIQNKVLSQSRRLPPLSGGECQQICLSGNPISDWDKRSARMRSNSVKNMSAYADQNHAPSLAVARLEYYMYSRSLSCKIRHKKISKVHLQVKGDIPWKTVKLNFVQKPVTCTSLPIRDILQQNTPTLTTS